MIRDLRHTVRDLTKKLIRVKNPYIRDLELATMVNENLELSENDWKSIFLKMSPQSDLQSVSNTHTKVTLGVILQRLMMLKIEFSLNRAKPFKKVFREYDPEKTGIVDDLKFQ